MISNRIKRRVFGFLAGRIGSPLLRLLAWSQNYMVQNEDALLDLETSETNFILAFWHGQMLPLLFYFSRSSFDQSSFHTFISPHRDGEYITRVVLGFGIKALRTSLRDRQLQALKRIHEIVDAGRNLAITPDGPVGPRMEAKNGVVKLSRRFDLPVLPVAALPQTGKYVSSWDRLCLPFPLGTLRVTFGRPQFYNGNRSLHENTISLEDTLNRLTRDVMVESSNTPSDYLDPPR